MSDLKPLTVDVPETCRMLGVGRSKVYELIDAGELERVRIGSRALVTFESIERLVERLRQAA